jgi:hypothetical protein
VSTTARSLRSSGRRRTTSPSRGARGTRGRAHPPFRMIVNAARRHAGGSRASTWARLINRAEGVAEHLPERDTDGDRCGARRR